VRRASVGSGDGSARPKVRSPYRCRDCGGKFWVISKRIYQRAALFLAFNLVFVAVVAGIVVLLDN